MEIAEAGHKKFGISQPLFINNLINSLVLDNQIDKALNEVNTLISQNPENASLMDSEDMSTTARVMMTHR